MMQISILTRVRDVMCPCILADGGSKSSKTDPNFYINDVIVTSYAN